MLAWHTRTTREKKVNTFHSVNVDRWRKFLFVFHHTFHFNAVHKLPFSHHVNFPEREARKPNICSGAIYRLLDISREIPSHCIVDLVIKGKRARREREQGRKVLRECFHNNNRITRKVKRVACLAKITTSHIYPATLQQEHARSIIK